MLFAFSCSILGFAFAIRTFTQFFARDLFDRAFMTKIGTAYLAFVIVAIFFVPHSRFALWCTLFFPLVILAIALSARLSRRSRIFQSDALNLMTLIILKMKSGRSFRSALTETVAESDSSMRAKFSEIASVVAFSQQEKMAQSDPFVRELVDEFRLIDQQPHASLRRLTVFREKIRAEDEFRRRSGQILARLRAQSLVMCGLFGAVLIFMITRFGFQANLRIYLTSSALFLAGVAWMWMGGRRLVWKV